MISFDFVLGIWAAIGASQAVPKAIFPAPWLVWPATVEMWQNGTPQKYLGVSLSRAAIGYSIGAIPGVVMGLLTGCVALVRTFVNPSPTSICAPPARWACRGSAIS